MLVILTNISKLALDIESCLYIASKIFDCIFVFADDSSVIIGVGVLLSILIFILLSAILMLVIKLIYIQKQYKKGKPASICML